MDEFKDQLKIREIFTTKPIQITRTLALKDLGNILIKIVLLFQSIAQQFASPT